MAKKRRGSRNTPQTRSTPSGPVGKTGIEELTLKEIIKDALPLETPPLSDATPSDEESLSCDKMPEEGTKAVNKPNRENMNLSRKLEDLAEQQRKLKEERKTLDVQKTEQGEKGRELAERERDLTNREEKLLIREIDADAGFAKRNRNALVHLEEEAKALQDELSAHRSLMADELSAHLSRMASDRIAFEEELERLRKSREVDEEQRQRLAENQLSAKMEELQKREEELQTQNKEIKADKLRLEAMRELFEEDKEGFDKKVELAAAGRIEKLESRCEALRECLEVSREERSALEKRLLEREDADLRFGAEKPEDVLFRLQLLQQERDDLRRELAQRPGIEAVERRDELERIKEKIECENSELRAEISALKQDLARREIAVIELESLRNHKDALVASNKLLEEDNKTLKEMIDPSSKHIVGPFPSCKEIDQKPEYNESIPSESKLRSLKDFAEEIQQGMAYGPQAATPLFYSAEDVRSFIGGLAMSRLHLLQGISGTGKTSLPRAFADAIGAGHELIAVQAGWRDRQDLIGYYNSFEKKFYEQQFLRALYMAGSPRYRNAPFFIVLDEMNLSHPEHYFADMLSALEAGTSLELSTAPLGETPERFEKKEGEGMSLPIPPNVWFIGTANHDETTKDFADKTYDRAYVLELPPTIERFDRSHVSLAGSSRRFSLEELNDAFRKAKEKHPREVEEASDFLKETLGEILYKRFRVGWGNRLQKHMEAYIPVVIECGGTLGESVDHILASKILRKIRDRHDNQPESVRELREKIDNSWSRLNASKARKSLALLDIELERLGEPVS